MENTKPSLSASALCAVPEVQAAYDAVDELFHDFHRRCTVGAERLDALIAAVRDATLSAERQRLLGLTSEQVVAAAIHAAEEEDRFTSQKNYSVAALVRAALPVLLAPERARREAVERERDDLGEMVKVAADDTKGYLALIEEMAAVTEAVREVCPSDETTGVREKFLYVCHDEDGESIVEANTLPEAVTQIIACWNQLAEQSTGIPQARYDEVRDELTRKAQALRAAEAEAKRLRGALEAAEGIVSRFVKARDAFHYDNFGGEVERHLERAMEDAYGFLHGLPDDLRAALGGSNG